MTHCFSRRTSSKEAQPPQRFFQARSSRLMQLFLKPKTACSPLSLLSARPSTARVRGREGKNGLLCWYGIPYGAAPTGESRWTAPLEPSRWQTVRDCTSPAPAATSTPLSPSAPRTA